jgi:hypothetical protein
MNKIKFLKNNIVRVNNVLYKGYLIGDLPPSFGYIYDQEKETEGITTFFNLKGLTYIPAK